MAFEEEFLSVQVLYQLSWEGKLEHPHMITVQYPSNQDGLRLRGKFPFSHCFCIPPAQIQVHVRTNSNADVVKF